jgi:hypothetical protein
VSVAEPSGAAATEPAPGPAVSAPLAQAPGLWIGLASAALGLLMIVTAWDKPLYVPGRGSGAFAFPLVVGWLGLIMGLLFAIRTVLGRDGRQPATFPNGSSRTRALCLMGLSVLYLVLLDKAGFLVANLVVGFACLRLLSTYPWWKLVLLTLIIAASLWYAFENLLGVELPRGFWASLG